MKNVHYDTQGEEDEKDEKIWTVGGSEKDKTKTRNKTFGSSFTTNNTCNQLWGDIRMYSNFSYVLSFPYIKVMNDS